MTDRTYRGDPVRGGEFWKGKPEFSKARWALWKRRFDQVSEMKELSEETRQIAREAVTKMIECEQP